MLVGCVAILTRKHEGISIRNIPVESHETPLKSSNFDRIFLMFAGCKVVSPKLAGHWPSPLGNVLCKMTIFMGVHEILLGSDGEKRSHGHILWRKKDPCF